MRTAENEECPTGQIRLGRFAEDCQRHEFRKENLSNTQLYSNSNAGGHWLHQQQKYPEKVHAAAGIYLQETPNQPLAVDGER